MARLYVSSKNESVRMFESNFLEFFSHVHPATPLVMYLPVTAFLLFYSFVNRHLSVVMVGALFVAGILVWTLLEYVIHRYVFHYQPKTRLGRQLHFVVHGVHHDYPQDATRLVMPPAVSIPVAIVFYVLSVLVFGRFAQTIFAGMLFGYVCYDCIHYATHHFALKGRLGLWLKQYHMRHHYQDDHAGYGISSPLWDYVFGTTRKSK
jgi:sterol desaturase/sphingolipid hydroxylase (fatty acid hydroxylase superfamily)